MAEGRMPVYAYTCPVCGVSVSTPGWRCMRHDPPPSELTGAALAEAVAVKVMGWRRDDWSSYADGPRWLWTGGGPLDLGKYTRVADFRPDLNIAQAWEVKDRMIALGWDFDYDEEPSHHEPPMAGFTKGADSYYAQAEIAPTAICRAALAAVEARP